ncbi:hypothetical protein MITS9509_00650 [Synechococcus sp. MIT S9509]|nr:hypothetical protein MITS9509_00650 [Synechococcus sp. MIT S9509]
MDLISKIQNAKMLKHFLGDIDTIRKSQMSSNSFVNHHRLEAFGKRSQPEPPTYALKKS